MTTYARAHTNIALIKYWGKANKQLMLPATSSISLTLNDFYTDKAVGVKFRPAARLVASASAANAEAELAKPAAVGT